MITKFLIVLFSIATLTSLADGPVIQTSPFMRNVLESQNSTDAQTRLGFTGNATLTVISNTAIGAMTPTSQNISNGMQYAIIASTNANYGVVDIRQWGAYVDGTVFNNIYATNGLSLYDPFARFTPSMVGLYCWLRFGGTNGLQDYTTTIASYISPSVLLLSAQPPYYTTNLPVVIGHDDSSAWQTAFNYYGANLQSVNFKIPVNPSLGYGISMICTNFSDTGDWRSHWNAQLHAPNMAQATTTPGVIWGFVGPTPIGRMWNSGYSPGFYPHGAVMLFTQPYGNAGTNWFNNINFAQETGGSTGDGLQHLYGVNNVGVYLEHITIMGSYNDNCHLWNAAGASRMSGYDYLFTGGFSQSDEQGVKWPNNTNTVGLDMPELDNDPGNVMFNGKVECFYTAVKDGENADFYDLNVYMTSNCVDFQNSGGNLMDFEGCNNFQGLNTAFMGATAPLSFKATGLNIQQNVWVGPNTNWVLVNDPGNNIFGSIEEQSVAGAYTGTNYGSVIGASGLDISQSFVNGQVNVGMMHSGAFRVDGSYNGGFPQTNAPKYFPFEYYNYSNSPAYQSTPVGAFMALWAASPQGNSLWLGGGGGGNPDSISRGVNNIYFETGPVDNGTINQDGYIDGNGVFHWSLNTINADAGFNLTGAQITTETSGDWNRVDGNGNNLTEIYGSTATSENFVWRIGYATDDLPNNNSSGYAWSFLGLVDGQKYACINTNASICTDGGFGSSATNVVAFSSSGITNTLNVDLRVWGFGSSGTTWLTNLYTGFKCSFGTVPQYHGHMIILQPGEALIGSGCIEDTNIAL